MSILRTLIVAATVSLAASQVASQSARQNIELQCYGGRNQLGLHLCSCDQGFISGIAAMVLGNVAVMQGPTTLMSCLEWADSMNGVSSPPPSSGTQTGQTDETTKPPSNGNSLLGSRVGGDTTPEETGGPQDTPPPLKDIDACSVAFNQCVVAGSPVTACAGAFNICNNRRRIADWDAQFERGWVFDTWVGYGGRQLVSSQLTGELFSGKTFTVQTFCDGAGRIGGHTVRNCDQFKKVSFTGAGWQVCDEGGANCATLPPLRFGGGSSLRLPIVHVSHGLYVTFGPNGSIYYEGNVVGTYMGEEEFTPREEPVPCPPGTWGARAPGSDPKGPCECSDSSTDMLCQMTSPHAKMNTRSEP